MGGGNGRYLLTKATNSDVGVKIGHNGDTLFVEMEDTGGGQIAFDADTTAISNNTWYHVALTYDGSQTLAGALLYINATLQAKANTTDTLSDVFDSNCRFLMGAESAGGLFNQLVGLTA